MTTVQVFDPPQCCATGVCGPTVEPALVRFAATVAWLKDQGVAVERFNLSQQPGAFAERPAVKSALVEGGTSCLPLVIVDGRIVSRGVYPTRSELAEWAGVATASAQASLPMSQGCCGGTSSCS
jgi:Arsenical resistance operon protein ArsD